MLVAQFIFINLIYSSYSQLCLTLIKINNDTKEDIIERILYSSQLNNLTITNIMNTQYNTNIKIGSDKQIYSVQVDTGSGWLWVSSVGQTGDIFTTNQFNCQISSSCSSTSHQIQIQYGSGMALGTLAFDSIDLGNEYFVENQPFLMVLYTSSFNTFTADGLLGLGSSIQTDGVPTLIDMLKAQQIIKQRTFSLYLSNNPNSIDTESRLIIGGYDTKYMLEDSLTYLNVVDPYYWAVGLISGSFGDISIDISSKQALIDSGTTLIVVAYADWPSFLESLQEVDSTCQLYDDTIACDCTEGILAYPSLNLILGDSRSEYSFSIPANDYILWYKGYCFPLVQTLKDLDMWILGDLFMIKYYTYFNLENQTIGFARSNPNPNTKPFKSISLYKKKLSFSIIYLIIIIYTYVYLY